MNLNLFPTSITVVKNFLSEEVCGKIYNYVLKNIDIIPLENHPALGTNNSKSTNYNINYNFLNIMEEKGILNIRDSLTNELKKYSNFSGMEFNYVDNCWISIQQKDKLEKHVHPFSNISGVIYINVDEKSSKIYFYNPNPMNFFYKKNLELKDMTYDYYKIVPSVGDLIMFPSWLQHGSNEEINQTENRLIISFNAL